MTHKSATSLMTPKSALLVVAGVVSPFATWSLHPSCVFVLTSCTLFQEGKDAVTHPALRKGIKT
ncbi:hypothetical protein M378DRAFT_164637 [Amanita muscaria Koide BX008]|uniref:Uncharacterized protein n=1 Tax=Amanita muscaria (strain Koide BX008) TaxID=946122 RepID=A0A0C2WNY1_AMAMK|nr:hypothetical protein M378DRAFT_164637 [Amanita muscaria Koide BX008]